MAWLCENISEGPQKMESKGAIFKICQVTWTQMFHAATLGGEKWAGVGDGHEDTLMPPLHFNLIFFPETKAWFAIWLKEQKRTEEVTVHFHFLSSFQSLVSRVEPWMA